MQKKESITWPYVEEKEAVKITKLSYGWFYKQRKSGRLKYSEHGRKIYYKTDELIKFWGNCSDSMDTNA